MTDEKIIEIRPNKRKILFLLIASITFTLGGGWILTLPMSHLPYNKNPFSKYIIGISSVIFFGFSSISLLIMLFNNKPTLILDEKGISAPRGKMSIDFIAWSEIVRIDRRKFGNITCIVIFTKHPRSYILRQTSLIKKISMYTSNKILGSPITIVLTGTTNQEMKNILDRISKYRCKKIN